MPKYNVLAKFGKDKRRSSWNLISAKNPKAAIKKAKSKWKKVPKHRKALIGASTATRWKAVKV